MQPNQDKVRFFQRLFTIAKRRFIFVNPRHIENREVRLFARILTDLIVSALKPPSPILPFRQNENILPPRIQVASSLSSLSFPAIPFLSHRRRQFPMTGLRSTDQSFFDPMFLFQKAFCAFDAAKPIPRLPRRPSKAPPAYYHKRPGQ